jgi:hypothetical protein
MLSKTHLPSPVGAAAFSEMADMRQSLDGWLQPEWRSVPEVLLGAEAGARRREG